MIDWYALIYFAIVVFIPNYFYKGRTFEDVSWTRTVSLSALFVAAIGFLGWRLMQVIFPLSLLTIPLFLLVSILWFVWPRIINQYGTYPAYYLKREPKRFLVRFDLKVTVIKYFEVVLQNVGFLFLVFVVFSDLNTWQLYAVFLTLVIVMHAANFFAMPQKWATFYLLLSIPMAPLFLFLIQNGLVFIAISIHLGFYIAHNSYFWLHPEKYAAPKHAVNLQEVRPE
ncbi:hypothetical protein C4579_03975 [Candidatus Microgenomates bacterium]|nr:MAG: hypothetical protein C4579_03975 [Candidatus Microgenomates bacterium]